MDKSKARPASVRSVPPRTEEIDDQWEELATGEAISPRFDESERPTAVPRVSPSEIAKRMMQETLPNHNEMRSALGLEMASKTRDEMPTLVDENAGKYDLEAPEPRAHTPTTSSGGPNANAMRLQWPAEPGGALELVSARSSTGSPLPDESSTIMHDRYAVGDFTGALAIAEKMLQENPSHAEAKRYADNCRDILTQMFSARLGPLSQVPHVMLGSDQIRWLTLDHRAGFLLSCIDGSSTVEEILDVAGMPKLDVLRVLCDLLQAGVIDIKAGR